MYTPRKATYFTVKATYITVKGNFYYCEKQLLLLLKTRFWGKATFFTVENRPFTKSNFFYCRNLLRRPRKATFFTVIFDSFRGGRRPLRVPLHLVAPIAKGNFFYCPKSLFERDSIAFLRSGLRGWGTEKQLFLLCSFPPCRPPSPVSFFAGPSALKSNFFYCLKPRFSGLSRHEFCFVSCRSPKARWIRGRRGIRSAESPVPLPFRRCSTDGGPPSRIPSSSRRTGPSC